MGDSPDLDEHSASAASAAELEAAGQSALFGAPEPAATPPAAPAPPPPGAAPGQPYRVLARKYRPQTFAELIGQDAMVQTLGNAIARDRLAHAFLMTGVRGVGKTSTARLIAKSLNCIGPDGQGGPTISPCGVCEPCRAISEGRFIDVIEMDAASNTKVEQMRELLDGVMYATVSGRFKIYIIDEVHMLSNSSFNAMLKTLEEPPPHVKFIFATTEVEKLPVTVLSRCQRFDLRRIPRDLLERQFAEICAKEGVEAEPEALSIIAAAAEGSSRDGLSILDQAIAHADLDSAAGGAARVTAGRVRDMLGLADRTAQRAIFTAIMAGEQTALLDAIDQQYALGVEPLALVRALMDFVHRIAVAQIGRAGGDAPTAEERAAIEEWAGKLPAAQLHRLWQLLLKGHDEVRQAPDPLVAAQMALLRVMLASDLPDPGKLAKELEALAARGPAPAASEAPAGAAGSPKGSSDWAQLVELVERSGQLNLNSMMKLQVQVVSLAPGELVYALAPGFTQDISEDLREGLRRATGERWQVRQVAQPGAPTMVELEQALAADKAAAVRREPLVEAVLGAFPGAEIVNEDQARAVDRAWYRKA